VERLAAVGILLAVEILVRLQTRIFGVAELAGLFVRNFTRFGTFAALRIDIL
jgi:hypothetical protein